MNIIKIQTKFGTRLEMVHVSFDACFSSKFQEEFKEWAGCECEALDDCGFVIPIFHGINPDGNKYAFRLNDYAFKDLNTDTMIRYCVDPDCYIETLIERLGGTFDEKN